MSKALAIPDSPRSLVYAALVNLFRADPTLKRVIDPGSWHVYLGDRPDDDAAFGSGELPAARLMPFGQGATPESNTRQNSPLGIRVDLLADGLDVRDLMDLWAAFEAVVFTGDGGRSVITALQAITPSVISVRLTAPAITVAPEGLEKSMMLATGTLSIEMTVRK